MSGLKAVALLVPFQFMFGLIYAWGAMAPVIRAATGWSVGVLDLMFAITPLILLPAVLIGGRLAGRLAPTRILGWASGCFIAGGLLALAGDAPVPFAIGYAGIALGVGGGLSTPACVEVIHRVAPQARGRSSGLLLAIYGLSATVSAPLFLWLAHHAAWRVALAIVMAGYGAAGVGALMALRSALRPGLAAEQSALFAPPASSLQPAHKPEQGIATPGAQPRAPWRPVAWNMLLLLATVPFGSAVFAAIGRLATGHGHAASLGVAGAAVMSLCNGIGRFAGGVLSDWLPIRVTWCIVPGLMACGYGAFRADAAFAGYGSPAVFLSFAVLTGLSFGALAGKLPALAAHTAPSNPAFVFSLYFGAFALGSFGGPFLSAIWGLPMTLTLFGATTVAAFAACVALAGIRRA